MSRGEIIKAYIPYLEEELAKGSNVHTLMFPLQTLFHGQRGSGKYKQHLSSSSIKKENALDLVNEIFNIIPEEVLWD